MKNLKIVTTLSVLMASSLVAGPYHTPINYQPPSGGPEIYVFGYGGISWIVDIEGSFLGGVNEYEDENGWTAGGGIGLRSNWLGGTRLEVEGLHASNDIDALKITNALGVVTFDASGDFDLTGVTVNFVKELVWGPLFPYVGLGIGYAGADAEVNAGPTILNDGASAFIWNVSAGLDIPYTDRTSLFLQYRFMPISDFVLTGNQGGISFDDVTNHTLQAGFRFKF